MLVFYPLLSSTCFEQTNSSSGGYFCTRSISHTSMGCLAANITYSVHTAYSISHTSWGV